eukprot:gene1107-1472_t
MTTVFRMIGLVMAFAIAGSLAGCANSGIPQDGRYQTHGTGWDNWRGLLGVGAAGLAMAGALAGRARGAAAQTFPSKQIRWVIPFAPGGNYDVTARIVSDPMGRHLGQ